MTAWKLIRPLGIIFRDTSSALSCRAMATRPAQTPTNGRSLLEAQHRTSPSLDPDVFGNLSSDTDLIDSRVPEEVPDDVAEETSRGHLRLASSGRRHTPLWYGRQIEKLGKEGKVAEAIRLFEVDMLEKDRVMPTSYVFTCLIGILGRAGYSKKAFQLFNKMKAMGLAVEEPTYTALFNACANSPWREDGLQRANELRRLMRAKDITPATQTYGAMVKAMAKCGSPHTAFEIIDEMIAAGRQPDALTFSSIMMACIEHQSAGFRLAVEVWKTMSRAGVKPSIFHYNLLLAAAERCGAGDRAALLDMRPVLVSLPKGSTASRGRLLARSRSGPSVPRSTIVEPPSPATKTEPRAPLAAEVVKSGLMDGSSIAGQVAVQGHHHASAESDVISSVAGFDVMLADGTVHRGIDLSTPSGRLQALGGVDSFLRRMDADGAKPTAKTFTMLLHLLPQYTGSDQAQVVSKAFEDGLLAAADSRGVALDATFFGALIRRRNLAGDLGAALDVLSLMSQRRLDADVRTYACIAMGCNIRNTGMDLLRAMKEAKVAPNIVIFNILMDRAHIDFRYRIMLCTEMEALGIQPDQKFIEMVSAAIEKTKKDIVLKEKGLKRIHDPVAQEKFNRTFSIFMLYYDGWRKRMPVCATPHPWQDYRYKQHDSGSRQDEAIVVSSP